MGTKTKEKNWHRSSYRGYWDWKSNKFKVTHRKPLRCPYCGKEMVFVSPIFYEYKSSRDWFWCCQECGLELPNSSEFSKDFLDHARKEHRKRLEKTMKRAKNEFEEAKKLYEAYGKYFTKREKRDRLIESIEEHGKEKPRCDTLL